MKICLKKSTIIDGQRFEKHSEGWVMGINWNDSGVFEYLVDFGKEGRHTVDAGDADILNCR